MNNTGHVVEQATKLNHKVEIVSNIKSGKEATVYRAMLDGHLVAMKVYKKPEERNFKNTGAYLLGKYYRRASERKAVAKKNKFAKKMKHENWVRREFFMLQELFDTGSNIPKPILQIDDAIFMELLGDINTVAPRLCDIELEKSEAQRAFDSVLKSVKTFWSFGIVHADLSEFNILWWKSQPYIIDFPQSIDRRMHPNPREILDRDLGNIVKYFGKYIVVDLEEIKSKFED
ncbi:MAG: RIO1 family regulatory kinase/ATPase [Candidatus Uhrbacteria bacterium]